MAIRILFLISALCMLSVSADVFVRIDCGTSDSYTDDNLITWTGDDDKMQNGVQTAYSVSPVMDSLRAFTTRSKNCYAIEATKEKRSFQIVMNNQTLLDEPFSPLYGNSTELYASNLTVSSNTTIELVPTANSTLPPLINAMEVFAIGDFLTHGTHTNDVDGLASLQNAFAELEDWSGDPCLPSPYYWDWINCSTGSTTPRVTALYLGSFGLSGGLPDFSGMDALETIDFQNNSLDGPIPEFLAALPNLKQLNLASNQFSGPIPDSLSEKNGLNLVVTGNPEVCTSGKSCSNSPINTRKTPAAGGSNNNNKKKKEKSKLGLILGTTIPIFLIIWAIVGALVVLRHRRKAAASISGAGGAGGENNRPQSSPLKSAPQMMNDRDEMKINLEGPKRITG